MGITAEDRAAMVGYRVEKALATYREAIDVFGLGHLSLCANRLYYSSFHMASALLINDGHSAQTHAGILRLINLNYVREGILSKEASKLMVRLFSMRQQGDYGDFFDYEKDEIEPLIFETESLLRQLRELIK